MSYISYNSTFLLSALVKIPLSVVFSFLIGIERELHSHPGGIMTHILVGLGSCLFTMCSVHISEMYPSATYDPARICAQIVSGMGFLGSATIYKSNNYVKGINTAANLWISAAISMAIGADMWEFALITSIFTISVLFLNNRYKVVTYIKRKRKKGKKEKKEKKEKKRKKRNEERKLRKITIENINEHILSNPKKNSSNGRILPGFCRSSLGNPMSSKDDIGFQRITRPRTLSRNSNSRNTSDNSSKISSPFLEEIEILRHCSSDTDEHNCQDCPICMPYNSPDEFNQNSDDGNTIIETSDTISNNEAEEYDEEEESDLEMNHINEINEINENDETKNNLELNIFDSINKLRKRNNGEKSIVSIV